jgi:hypothetical protein
VMPRRAAGVSAAGQAETPGRSGGGGAETL